MTNQQIKELIQVQIKDAVNDNSITPSILGNLLDELVNNDTASKKAILYFEDLGTGVAPTVTHIINNIANDFVFNRYGRYIYAINSASAPFTVGKTMVKFILDTSVVSMCGYNYTRGTVDMDGMLIASMYHNGTKYVLEDRIGQVSARLVGFIIIEVFD